MKDQQPVTIPQKDRQVSGAARTALAGLAAVTTGMSAIDCAPPQTASPLAPTGITEQVRPEAPIIISTPNGDFSVKLPEVPKNAPLYGATPESTLIPSKYSVKADGNVTYKENGIELNVPQIPGLKAELQRTPNGDKVVYLAQAENPYGLAFKENAGQYKPNVSMEIDGVKKQTGGVVLTPPVVTMLIQDNLKETGKTWIAPIPVDVRDTNQEVKLDTFRMPVTKDFSIDFLRVVLTEDASLLNTIPGRNNLLLRTTTFDKGLKSYMRNGDAKIEGSKKPSGVNGPQ